MNLFISDDVTADKAIEDLRELGEVKARLERVTRARIEELTEQNNKKIESLTLQEEDIKAQLRAYSLSISDSMKHTKTQAKYILPAGTIVVKKPKKTLTADKDTLLNWAKENDKELVKEKITETIDWATLKKDLEILDDGQVLRKSTGEILEIEAIQVKETAEELEVKF